MIAIVFAGKYPERTTSVVINCAAAKLGAAGRLVFKNWIDIATLDPDGPGSRILAELIAWQALSKAFLETPDGVAAIDTIQQILRDSNRIEVFTAACQAMCDMDIRAVAAADHVARARARRRRGSDDARGTRGPAVPASRRSSTGSPVRRQHVIRGSNHSTIFDNTAEHNRVVIDFFTRHGRQRARRGRRGRGGGRSARGRGVRRRADPGGAPHGRLARPVRDQLHLLPQPGHVRARGARGRGRRAAALVGGGGDGARPGARVLVPRSRSPRSASTMAFPGRWRCGRRSASGALGSLSSPYRVVAATYWFAAQALTSAYGFQAIVQTMTGHRLPLVPVAIGLALVPRHSRRARLRRDALRPAHRAAALARAHGRAARALSRLGRSALRRRTACSARRTSTSPGSASRRT